MDRVEEFLTVYLPKRRRRPPATVRSYGLNIRRLERFCNKPMWEITAEDLWRFDEESPYAPRTTQVTVATAHSYHKFEAAMGYVQLNGILMVPVRKVDDDVPKPSLSDLQAMSFLMAAEDPDEIRITHTGLFAGARISGAFIIDEEHWGEDRIRWPEKGRWREVPIHPELAQKKAVILGSRPRNVRALERAVERLKRKTGIFQVAGPPRTNVSSHIFRRTFSTKLLDKDVQLWMVEGLMGHRITSMTLRAYASVPIRRKQADLDKVEYGTGQLKLW